ncbi:MAG TPA: cytochrome c oxidase subunit 3 [Gemmatimonadaceae bacterium]|nr:cytochrome c oxidase subunit 3 [Gemmatimonadaceae bacterium]
MTSTRVVPLAGASRPVRSLGWWGIWMVVLTEGAFFAFLLFSYFYTGSLARGAWPPHGNPELTLTSVNTAILLASSGVLWWGDRSLHKGHTRRLMIALAVTIVLGVVFLGVQGVEYSRKAFGPDADAYGSLFFTITGFHGAHVAVGIIMLATTLVRAWRGHFAPTRRVGVTVTAIYWHFVDVVWLVVFTSLYVSPHLGVL